MNGIVPLLFSLSLFSLSPVKTSETSKAKLSINDYYEYHNSGTNYCDFAISSFNDVASLSLEIHYDSSIISMTNSYNHISGALFDCNLSTPGIVKVSYIFPSTTKESQTLFTLQYEIPFQIENTSTSFDVFVSECSDFSLQEIPLSGFTYTIKIQNQNYTYPQEIHTTLDQSIYEYESLIHLSLEFPDYHPAFTTGTILISYDIDDLILAGFSFADNFSSQSSLKEANTSQKGSITLSFVSTKGISSKDICSLSFQIKRNETFSSKISIEIKDVLDDSNNSISFSKKQQSISIKKKKEKINGGTFSLNSKVKETNYTVDTTLSFETKSNIGAGDFTLTFDSEKLQYLSSEILIPKEKITSLLINEKETKNGKLTFHIINSSTYSFSESENLIYFHFSSKEKCHPYNSGFILNGESTYDASLKESTYDYKADSFSFTTLTHDFKTEEIPATCTNAGSITKTCLKCGETNQEIIPKTGHNYSDWIIEKEPTCTEKGNKYRTCSACGKKENIIIDELGHSLTHYNGKEPSCTENGYKDYDFCSNCDYSTYTEIPALGHDYQKKSEIATCTKNGFITYICSRCHDIDKTKSENIPATGHNYSEWKVEKEPTEKEEGIESRTCSICHHKEERYIEKLRRNYTPIILITSGIIGILLLGLIIVLIHKKKKI